MDHVRNRTSNTRKNSARNKKPTAKTALKHPDEPPSIDLDNHIPPEALRVVDEVLTAEIDRRERVLDSAEARRDSAAMAVQRRRTAWLGIFIGVMSLMVVLGYCIFVLVTDPKNLESGKWALGVLVGITTGTAGNLYRPHTP